MRSTVIALGSTTHRNRVGRVYSLWLTARAAGLRFRYFGVDDGAMWEPLRDHAEFLADVHTGRDLDDVERQVRAATGRDTTILVCKPRPELIRLGRKLATSQPVVVDIDDPELLDPWSGMPYVVRAKRIVRLGLAPHRFHWARRVVTTMNVITSNPTLQDLYGGEIVPHVRDVSDEPTRRPNPSEPFVVGFVGTVREHKGVRDLRSAVAMLAGRRSVRLCITAAPPFDAFPWEEWVGATTLAEGRALVERCNAVAILSRPGAWGDHQLPVKLIDAMATGVPLVTTPRPPLLWAAGSSAIVVRDDAPADIADAFAALADDPALARARGAAAWDRARTMFTPDAAAPHLVRAIELADVAFARTHR